MTKAIKWGNLPDEKCSLLLRKLLVDIQSQPLETIQEEFERRSGHRVEAHVIQTQACALDMRFCASSLFKDAPLRDFAGYEKIDGKDVEIGLVAMSPDGAVLLQLGTGGGSALLWNDNGKWVTILDEDLDGKPLHESQEGRKYDFETL